MYKRQIVGASTEIEMRERKERLDDALNATQAAIQQGIVVGGGKGILTGIFSILGQVDILPEIN